MSSMLSKFLVSIGIQWVGWAVATTLKTEKFYDITGSVTFCYLVLRCLAERRQSLPQKIQAAGVFIWALRLGSFLFLRILKEGRDRRFDLIKQNHLRFLTAWTLQGIGVWVFVTLLPSMFMWSNETANNQTVTKRHAFAWALFLIGFLFETIADYQKWTFRNDPNNKGKFICSGLWSISRHPNYFGEILLWFGLSLSSIFSSTSFGWKEILSLLCPVFDALLITKISGVPILEKQATKRWGRAADYTNYVSKTAILIPYIW